MGFWNKLFGKAAAGSIRCGGCGVVYTPGVDAVCTTSTETDEYFQKKGAVTIRLTDSESSRRPEVLMIGKSTVPDNPYVRSSEATILRLGPKIGWQCQKCHTMNAWKPHR
jgi:hypothetical protein